MTFLIINQYGTGSGYKDKPGELYHFPHKYHSRFPEPPTPFLYYEPSRQKGRMVYFGMGVVRAIVPDVDEVGYYYANLGDYQPFTRMVPLHDGPGDDPWEGAKVMQNSVREITGATFNAIAEAGGILIPTQGKVSALLISDLQAELQQNLQTTPSKSAQKLRKIQRIYEAYERPSAITNTVKKRPVPAL